MSPFVRILHFVDNENKYIIGYIYEVIDIAKEMIQMSVDGIKKSNRKKL